MPSGDVCRFGELMLSATALAAAGAKKLRETLHAAERSMFCADFRAQRSQRIEARPLEGELTTHRQRSPERCELFQACDDALDVGRVCGLQLRGDTRLVWELTSFAPPCKVAHPGEAFGFDHLGRGYPTLRAQTQLALALLALLTRACTR